MHLWTPVLTASACVNIDMKDVACFFAEALDCRSQIEGIYSVGVPTPELPEVKLTDESFGESSMLSTREHNAYRSYLSGQY